MTIDDENSIYVGGIPYDCTESQLRRIFELYGSVVAVKIINDRRNCYGFVTFKNPRSVIEAISDMDGQTIGGRVVRVNEVKSRGAGPNLGRESLRHNQRKMDRNDVRGRERENDYGKERQHGHSREHDGERERRRDRSRDHFLGRDRDKSREMGDWDGRRVHSRSRDLMLDRDKGLKGIEDREFDKVGEHNRRVDRSEEQHARRKNSSSSCERKTREFLSESSGYQYQVEEQLDLLVKRRNELQNEKSDMEKRLEEKKRLIADLQKRSLKLEDLLASAKKQSSMSQMWLNKLYKCLQQVKEYGEKMKSSEEVLQDLVNSVSMELDAGDDLRAKDAYVTNGKL